MLSLTVCVNLVTMQLLLGVYTNSSGFTIICIAVIGANYWRYVHRDRYKVLIKPFQSEPPAIRRRGNIIATTVFLGTPILFFVLVFAVASFKGLL